VDDVRRRAVLLPKLGEFLIEFTVLNRPRFSVLGFNDVVLGVVDDFLLGLR
jgi:hypothetical protein